MNSPHFLDLQKWRLTKNSDLMSYPGHLFFFFWRGRFYPPLPILSPTDRDHVVHVVFSPKFLFTTTTTTTTDNNNSNNNAMFHMMDNNSHYVHIKRRRILLTNFQSWSPLPPKEWDFPWLPSSLISQWSTIVHHLNNHSWLFSDVVIEQKKKLFVVRTTIRI